MSLYPGQDLSTDELLYALGKDLERKLSRPYPPFDFREVDALEKSLSRISTRIRTMRNALVPVNKLPVEILQQVPSWLPYVSEVVATSHVCRYWRAAFLSCPNLWTFLDCKSTPATRAYIERSGVSPLQISIRPGYSYNAFVYTIPHAQRWGSFSATVAGEEIEPVLAVLSGPSSAPKLYNLSIVPMIGFTEGDTVISKGKILGGVIPLLERLTLSNLKIEMRKLTAPNLTHLFLASSSPDFVDMTAVLDFFKRSPLLEEVELRYPGPRVADRHIQIAPLLSTIFVASFSGIGARCT